MVGFPKAGVQVFLGGPTNGKPNDVMDQRGLREGLGLSRIAPLISARGFGLPHEGVGRLVFNHVLLVGLRTNGKYNHELNTGHASE